MNTPNRSLLALIPALGLAVGCSFDPEDAAVELSWVDAEGDEVDVSFTSQDLSTCYGVLSDRETWVWNDDQLLVILDHSEKTVFINTVPLGACFMIAAESLNDEHEPPGPYS